jgi:hypothetical protein
MLYLEEEVHIIKIYIYIKQFLYRPGQVWIVPEGYRKGNESSRF